MFSTSSLWPQNHGRATHPFGFNSILQYRKNIVYSFCQTLHRASRKPALWRPVRLELLPRLPPQEDPLASVEELSGRGEECPATDPVPPLVAGDAEGTGLVPHQSHLAPEAEEVGLEAAQALGVAVAATALVVSVGGGRGESSVALLMHEVERSAPHVNGRNSRRN